MNKIYWFFVAREINYDFNYNDFIDDCSIDDFNCNDFNPSKDFDKVDHSLPS